MSDHKHEPTIIKNEQGQEIGGIVDDCGPECREPMQGGMPDLFDMARETDENAAPMMGEYVDGGHAAVVEDVVIGDGIAWSTNRITGKQKSELIMLLGFETIDGSRHMFTLRSEEIVYLMRTMMERVLPKMVEDQDPERKEQE